MKRSGYLVVYTWPYQIHKLKHLLFYIKVSTFLFTCDIFVTPLVWQESWLRVVFSLSCVVWECVCVCTFVCLFYIMQCCKRNMVYMCFNYNDVRWLTFCERKFSIQTKLNWKLCYVFFSPFFSLYLFLSVIALFFAGGYWYWWFVCIAHLSI